MILRPGNVAELAQSVAQAHAAAAPVGTVDLGAMSGLLEYHPEDLTVTVQTGITLRDLQAELARHRQWLPIDPADPANVTIDQVLNENLSGPRRFGYGTIREHLLGITAVLADGRIIHNGGKVVKNVAGFDLCKLFVGSQRSLGIIAEATFKLWPKPAEEQFVTANFAGPGEAAQLLRNLQQSAITPVVLDLYSTRFRECALLLGFAGTPAEVQWQLQEAARLGISRAASLEDQQPFWINSAPVSRFSILPSRLTTEIEAIKPDAFVARAGNGIIYYRGGRPPARPKIPETLNQRVKELFDPKNILPAMRAL